MGAELQVALLVGGALAFGFLVVAVIVYIHRDHRSPAVETLYWLADSHPDLTFESGAPIDRGMVAGEWKGCEVEYRTSRVDDNDVRYYRTEIDVEPVAASDGDPGPADGELPEGFEIAPPDIFDVELTRDGRSLSFRMRGAAESVEECEQMLDELVALVTPGDGAGPERSMIQID